AIWKGCGSDGALGAEATALRLHDRGWRLDARRFDRALVSIASVVSAVREAEIAVRGRIAQCEEVGWDVFALQVESVAGKFTITDLHVPAEIAEASAIVGTSDAVIQIGVGKQHHPSVS